MTASSSVSTCEKSLSAFRSYEIPPFLVYDLFSSFRFIHFRFVFANMHIHAKKVAKRTNSFPGIYASMHTLLFAGIGFLLFIYLLNFYVTICPVGHLINLSNFIAK